MALVVLERMPERTSLSKALNLQPHTVEAALEERLAEQSVKVLRGHELTGFEQDPPA